MLRGSRWAAGLTAGALVMVVLALGIAGAPQGTGASALHPAVAPVALSNSTLNSTPVIGLAGTAPVGQFPSGMAADSANGYVYVTNKGAGTVSILNGPSVVGSLLLGAGANGIVYDTAGRLVFVSVYQENEVDVLSGTAMTASIPVGIGPGIPAYDPNNAYVYVPNFGSDTVSVVNSTSVIATLSVGSEPTDATFDSATGDVYVTNEESGSESLINGTTVVANISTRLVVPFYSLFDPLNDYLYVTNYTPTGGTVSAVSILNGTSIVGYFIVGPGPGYPTLNTQNGRVYLPISGQDVVDIINGTSYATRVGVQGYPEAAAYDPENNLVYVPDDLTDDVAVINGSALSDDIAVGVNPDSVLYNPHDGQVYVTDTGSSEVSVLGLVTGWAVRFTETGLPAGTAWSVAVRGVTVEAITSTVVQFEPNGSYYFQVTGPSQYSANPSQGSFTVDGAPMTVGIAFSTVTPPPGLGILELPSPWGWVLIGGIVAGATAVIVYELNQRNLRKKERIGRL
jgi:YVTN family beta-propeller protein